MTVYEELPGQDPSKEPRIIIEGDDDDDIDQDATPVNEGTTLSPLGDRVDEICVAVSWRTGRVIQVEAAPVSVKTLHLEQPSSIC